MGGAEGECTGSCEARMMASTFRPPSTSAAAVSSHEDSMPSTIIGERLAREGRHGHQPQPARFPSRHVLLQEPHRQRMPVGDHDDPAPPPRPSRHLLPSHPAPRPPPLATPHHLPPPPPPPP